jgi:hypothetical protein
MRQRDEADAPSAVGEWVGVAEVMATRGDPRSRARSLAGSIRVTGQESAICRLLCCLLGL